jgi:hypothetical protein
MVLIFIALITFALERMVRSPWGRMLRAIREDEDAAAALGKNAFAIRLQTFVLGSMLMGLAGALYANFLGFISPQDLLPIFTFQVFVMLVVGGSGNNYGALLGAVIIWACGRSPSRCSVPSCHRPCASRYRRSGWSWSAPSWSACCCTARKACCRSDAMCRAKPGSSADSVPPTCQEQPHAQ